MNGPSLLTLCVKLVIHYPHAPLIHRANDLFTKMPLTYMISFTP